ncbi:MAG TPA: winged helix-turn-helix domain-containing protein [Candidatus Acidoferrales bacterium]|nr:winged helix-turn-helix domain-containing protein [Candidatus Acidoferrales bacterium]
MAVGPLPAQTGRLNWRYYPPDAAPAQSAAYHFCVFLVYPSSPLKAIGLFTESLRSGRAAAPDFELDLGRYELRRSGRRIRLQKKPMELLIFFVQRREQLVTRDDIAARLWESGLFLDTERNINNIIRKIRAALGDNPAKPRFLETVVGKGYRFVGPVRVISPLYPAAGSTQEHAGAPSAAAAGSAGSADHVTLAVLPLRTLGALKDDTGFCLGFADALVSHLANLDGVDVLPTEAVVEIPANARPAEIAARLGARFVVHGAIRLSKGETRLSVELLDSHSHSSHFVREFALDPGHPFALVDEIAAHVSRVLSRPPHPPGLPSRARYSRDPVAYAEFIQGYQRSSSGDPQLLAQATQFLLNAVTRDPAFALAHAVLSFVCAAQHFEFDPSRAWLEKAEFHCRRALELDAALPEGHVAKAFLLWGPSKNFQHAEALAELKRALALQKNLPHAYNRMGTILAHIGLLDHARTMFERGSAFNPKKAVSHSILQVHIWSGDYDLAAEELRKWLDENPSNKYPVYFAPQLAILTGNYEEAKALLAKAAASIEPDEPLITSLQGVLFAATGKPEQALRALNRACTNPKSFGHAHHTYYQNACILSLLGRSDDAFPWLERAVDTGFACWPFFKKDPCLKDLRSHPQFDLLVSSLQAKYPDHLGLL